MNPKKPKSRKSKSAGISLEPDLIKRGKDFAEKNGMKSLSNLVRFLLTKELGKPDGMYGYMVSEDEKTSPLPHPGGVVITPRKTSAGGSGTPTIRYPKPRAKSSK